MADSSGNPGSAIDKIKLVIVDDDLFVRTSLSKSLPKLGNFVATGTFANGCELIAAPQLEPPDVILMDIAMPQMGGVEATQKARQRWRRVKVIALTSFADQFYIDQMRAAGAVGYLFKDTPPPAMARAIEAAYMGIAVMSPNAVPEASGRRPDGLERLSKTEAEILELVCIGQTNIEIAAELSMAPSTIKHYVSGLMERFGASNRTVLAVRLAPHVNRPS